MIVMKTGLLRKICPTAMLSTSNLTWTAHAAKLGFSCTKPVPSHLGYGTALIKT
jgi:hypothetical protein